MDLKTYLQVFTNRRIAVTALLAISSGLPFALTSGTLQAWLAVEKVDIAVIGLFTMIGYPYSLKFLWSPLMDRFSFPWLGRRRSWILISQISLVFGIVAMAYSSPRDDIAMVAILALAVAVLSASQDIVIDAHRTDLLKKEERGAGAAVFVLGYRIALLISGALALKLSVRIGWSNTYLLMAALMGIGTIVTIFSPEPDAPVQPRSLKEAVIGPLKDYFSRSSALIFLVFIVLYKLGDAYAGALSTAFVISALGFSPDDVGDVNKGFGLVSLIIGSLVGGSLMVRLGLYRALLVFGILQAVSNLSFMLLAWAGKNYWLLVFSVGFENLCGGMGTSAFLALLMTMCNHRFSATQYALLSSLASLGRNFISPTSGFLVQSIGWPLFFFFTAVIAVPGLLFLWKLRPLIESLKDGEEQA